MEKGASDQKMCGQFISNHVIDTRSYRYGHLLCTSYHSSERFLDSFTQRCSRHEISDDSYINHLKTIASLGANHGPMLSNRSSEVSYQMI